jgi:hypothetical protein
VFVFKAFDDEDHVRHVWKLTKVLRPGWPDRANVLASFFFNLQKAKFWGYFFHGKRYILILAKMGWAPYILGIFLTNSSGHLVWDQRYISWILRRVFSDVFGLHVANLPDPDFQKRLDLWRQRWWTVLFQSQGLFEQRNWLEKNETDCGFVCIGQKSRTFSYICTLIELCYAAMP